MQIEDSVENEVEIKITSPLGEILYGQPKISIATPRFVECRDDVPRRGPLYGAIQPRVKELLKNENLTIDELASKIGVSTDKIYNALRHLRDNKLVKCTGEGIKGKPKLWYLVK